MKKKKFAVSVWILLGLVLLQACSQVPKGAVVVSFFKIEKYLGKWYEIARLDFRYEKDLNNTTVEYSLNSDGTIKVKNQGYNYKKKKWVHFVGKAKFADTENIAMLKVSFFGPFFSNYNIIALDADYKYALIVGKNKNYLWILSRDKTIPEDVKQVYLKIAEDLDYNTSDLVWVEHDK